MRKLGHVVLYLDDIEDIADLLRSHAANVMISAGNAIAENGAADLAGARRHELHELEIRATQPTVCVRLKYSQACVGTVDRTVAARSLVDKVADLLAERRRPFTADLSEYAKYAALLGAVAIVFPYVLFSEYRPGHYYIIAASFIWPVVIAQQIVASLRKGRARIIRSWLSDKYERSRGFRRDVAVGIASVVVTTIISVVTKFVGLGD